MKKTLILLFVFCVGTFHCFGSYDESIIAAILMVKNEEQAMEKTLQPLVDGGIDTFFIYDTGSTDNTVEVTENFFADHNLTHTKIVQEPFINFAASRNRALDLAEEAFPEVDFLLFLDAEWHLHNAEELVTFCHEEKLKNAKNKTYLFRLLTTDSDFYRSVLMRNHSNVRYVGVVHEAVNHVDKEKVPSTIYFSYNPCNQGRIKSKQRWERDLDLLVKDNHDHPNNPRTLFYLAQTYACLGDFENAYIYYKKREKISGWDEENFITRYRLGCMAELLDRWPEAMEHFLEAYSMRPQRIEPLVKIAAHYLEKKDYANGYLFAKRAADTPYPNNDILFIEKEMYDYTRYDILGQCAWYINEREVGFNAVNQALKAKPNFPHLHFNFALYNTNEDGFILPYPEKMERKLLITGTPHCGTNYISSLLNAAGFPIGHEFLSSKGCSSWAMGIDADTSPWGPPAKNIEFEHIFHQVRNPLKVISSMQTTPKKTWEYLSAHIPEISMSDPLFVRCANYWYYWNLKCEEKAHWRYRIEDIDLVFDEMGDYLGVTLDKSALSTVSRDNNSRAEHYKELTWRDLEYILDNDLYEKVTALALSYGYSVED